MEAGGEEGVEGAPEVVARETGRLEESGVEDAAEDDQAVAEGVEGGLGRRRAGA